MATAATIASTPPRTRARARARPRPPRDVRRRRWRLDTYMGISYIALLLRISTVRTQYAAPHYRCSQQVSAKTLSLELEDGTVVNPKIQKIAEVHPVDDQDEDDDDGSGTGITAEADTADQEANAAEEEEEL